MSDNPTNGLYAVPRDINKLEDCYFYHTMDLPGYGTVQGEWDLRGRERSYLGNTDFKGKTVLEIGTASGHLCFYMEKQGASITAFDLCEKYEWDTVPFHGRGHQEKIQARKEHLQKLNNSYWLAHRAFNSKARMVYGTVYQMPEELGQFDIGTFGCVLLHLRDPFLAVQRACEHIKDKIIITEAPHRLVDISGIFHFPHMGKWVRFLPDAASGYPDMSWWGLTPELLVEFVKILGFEKIKLSYHTQIFAGKKVRLYTVVGQR